jgi:hypothetical protein
MLLYCEDPAGGAKTYGAAFLCGLSMFTYQKFYAYMQQEETPGYSLGCGHIKQVPISVICNAENGQGY